MREAIFSKAAQKDIIRLKKRGYKRSGLDIVLEAICRNGMAPLSSGPHKLHGEWQGCWECHIEHDLLLIYTINPTSVAVHRTGSHADLFE